MIPLREGLEKALEFDGGHTIEDVVALLLEDKAQLWQSDRAAIVTEIHDLPQARIIHFWLAAGDLEDVVDLSNRVLEWAKSVGCTRATLTGRKGWERVLAPEGWNHSMIVMERGI